MLDVILIAILAPLVLGLWVLAGMPCVTAYRLIKDD